MWRINWWEVLRVAPNTSISVKSSGDQTFQWRDLFAFDANDYMKGFFSKPRVPLAQHQSYRQESMGRGEWAYCGRYFQIWYFSGLSFVICPSRGRNFWYNRISNYDLYLDVRLSSWLNMGLPMKLGHGSFPGGKSQHIERWGDSYIECMEASIDRY